MKKIIIFISSVLIFYLIVDCAQKMPINQKISYMQKINLSKTNKIPTILVACGSFSPITNSHLRMLENARDHLHISHPELHVIGGFLSPVGDAYNKKGLIPSKHRVAMAKLAVSDSYWIDVHPWEASQQTHQRTLVVLQHIREEIKKNFNMKNVRIFLVCGTDLLNSFNIPNVWSFEDQSELTSDHFGIMVVQRTGLDASSVIWKNDILWKNQKNIFIAPPIVKDTTSSTLVRDLIKRNMSVRYMIPALVIDYIQKNNLYI